MKSKVDQLVKTLTDQILNGEYSFKEAVPSERMLAEKYNISRMTARKALQILNDEDIIYRKTPRKYFISKNIRDRFSDYEVSKPGVKLNIAFVMHPRWSHHTVLFELYTYLKKELPPEIHLQAYFDYFLQENIYHKNNIDMIIADHGFRDEELEMVEEKGVKTVVILRDREHGNFVTSDDTAGGYLIGKFLAEKGHQKIACFRWGPEKSECNMQTTGFLKAARDFGLTPVTVSIDPHTEIGKPRDAVEYLIARNIEFTCVLGPDDEHAFDIISLIQQKGYKVPEDISVFGYGDVCFAREAVIPLTTVRKPLPIMAKHLQKAIVKFLNTGKLEICRKMIPELIVRNSVKNLFTSNR